MDTAIITVAFFACMFGMLASFKAALRHCRAARGSWWNGPAFATGLIAIPFAWMVILGCVVQITRNVFPVVL